MENPLDLLGRPAPRFHRGQAIVCIDPTITHEKNPGISCHLSLNVIYHVRRIEWRWGRWFLTLDAWQEFVFEEVHFAPAELLPDAAIAELLEEASTTVVG